MSFLDRALRMGEAKKFKSYEQRVARINAYEPEMESSTDEELRELADDLRERASDGESLDDLLHEMLRAGARSWTPGARDAPLRRAADRRHGPS